jgi:hypothetical protein
MRVSEACQGVVGECQKQSVAMRGGKTPHTLPRVHHMLVRGGWIVAQNGSD